MWRSRSSTVRMPLDPSSADRRGPMPLTYWTSESRLSIRSTPFKDTKTQRHEDTKKGRLKLIFKGGLSLCLRAFVSLCPLQTFDQCRPFLDRKNALINISRSP